MIDHDALTLLEAAKKAQCSCDAFQRDSGHLVDCWMPELLAAIEAVEQPSPAAEPHELTQAAPAAEPGKCEHKNCAALRRAEALQAENARFAFALAWANREIPGQVSCAECGYIAGGHAVDCGYGQTVRQAEAIASPAETK